MEKQKLLYQQARLHDRGAAEMVLQTISASKGKLIFLNVLTLYNFYTSTIHYNTYFSTELLDVKVTDNFLRCN